MVHHLSGPAPSPPPRPPAPVGPRRRWGCVATDQWPPVDRAPPPPPLHVSEAPATSQANEVKWALEKVGQADKCDEIADICNRSAEQASGEAFDILTDGVLGMSLADAKAILMGEQDEATHYMRETCYDDLAARYPPVPGWSCERSTRFAAPALPCLPPLLFPFSSSGLCCLPSIPPPPHLPMGTTADGGKGSKGRAANGDRPIGASCRREQ